MSGPSSRVLRVEVRRGAAQEAGLQDVSAASVGEEAALVQVHLLAGCLEVQRHCGNKGVNKAVGTATPAVKRWRRGEGSGMNAFWHFSVETSLRLQH